MHKQLNWLFTFLIAFSGYLFFVRPATTGGQLLFRIGVLVFGVAGLLTLALLRLRIKNAAEPTQRMVDNQA